MMDLLLVPLFLAIVGLELSNRERLGRLLQWTIDHDRIHDGPNK